MKHLLKAILALLLFLNTQQVFSLEKTDNSLKNFNLIPEPQKVEILPGNGLSFNTLKGINLRQRVERPVLYGIMKTLPLSSKSGMGILTLNITSDKKIPDSHEGYVLEIQDGGVTINARSQAGLFYGCQTLLQLLSDARDQRIDIPSCRITDYPDIAYRAVHLDLKHHMNHIKDYYTTIDRLARIKVNAVIVELEDKLRYRNTPVIGAGNSIPVEQFAALSRYAHERNIEISPLIQGLGHASYILKHAQYKHLREDPASDWAFSPLDSGTYKLLFSLYEEAMEATPHGKYLHIGGDEVGSLGSSALSKQSGMSAFELQMYWLKKVCDFAYVHGRIPIFWDDMVLKQAGLYETTYKKDMPRKEVDRLWKENRNKLDSNIQLFPKNCIYMRWSYLNPSLPGNIKMIEWYDSHELKVMAATAAQTTWMMLPRNHSNFQSIKEFCRISAHNNLEGILCTAWDDSSPLFETYWRGLYYFSLFSWNYKDISLKESESLFRKRFYGSVLGDASYEFEDLLEQNLYFWENALMRDGNRRTNKSVKLITLPDPKNSGEWTKEYKEKIDGAQKAVNLYTETKKRIREVMEKANRNLYSLFYLNQLNEMQIYPAKLLLLLRDYDQATGPEKDCRLKHVLDYVNSFSHIRQSFEYIFSETRTLNTPKGYQPDQGYRRHWASITLNSDWMYIIELKVNKKIYDWAKNKRAL